MEDTSTASKDDPLQITMSQNGLINPLFTHYPSQCTRSPQSKATASLGKQNINRARVPNKQFQND